MAKKKMTLEEKLEEAIVKDAPYEVSENWVWSNIRSTCGINMGQSPSGDKVNETGDGYPLVGGPSDMGEYYPLKRRYTTDANKISSNGTIIMSIRATLGKINISDGEYCLGRGVAELKPYTLKRDYIRHYINYISNDLYKFAKGTTFLQISKPDLEKISIPIPPLQEQQRIVDRIESLFEKLDNAKELIEEARDNFEKRKSAILEKAFRGELTAEWRKERNIPNNVVELLLKENSVIKKNFNFTIAKDLFVLPEGWQWIKLKDICEKFKYGTSSKSKEEGRVPVLRMGNLQGGKLDWGNLVYTSDEEEISKYDLKSGDLLFNRTNSPELVGKTSIYEGEREAIYAGYLIRVRTLESINSRYINYFMNSIYAKHRCIEVKSDGVSQSNINAEKLGDFDIPVPSTEEQNEIVRILDNLLEEESKIDELTQLEEQIELIKKSILAKAFRGQLGTNCPEEESALELLKEILDKE